MDDPRRVVVGGRGFEQAQQALGQKEHRLDVGVHHLVPAGLGVLLDGSAPRRTSVVDENVEVVGVLAYPGAQRAPMVDNGGDGDAALAGLFAQAGGGGVAHVGLARADDRRRTVVEESAGDHLADAARSSGDEHGLAANAEELRDVERGHGWSLGRSAAMGSRPRHPRAVTLLHPPIRSGPMSRSADRPFRFAVDAPDPLPGRSWLDTDEVEASASTCPTISTTVARRRDAGGRASRLVERLLVLAVTIGILLPAQRRRSTRSRASGRG
jgi:hypothetical protein